MGWKTTREEASGGRVTHDLILWQEKAECLLLYIGFQVSEKVPNTRAKNIIQDTTGWRFLQAGDFLEGQQRS